MQYQKLFLELRDSDYDTDAKRYNIQLKSQDIRNPSEVVFESVTVRVDEDSDYLLIHSNALADIARRRPAGTNDKYGNVVYVLNPKERILRSTTSTTTQSGGNSGDGSDSAIELIPDLKLWLDFDPSRALDATYQETPNLGDTVRYCYNRSPADNTMLFVTNKDFEIMQIGSNAMRGMGSTQSWAQAVDASLPNYYAGQTFTTCYVIHTPPTYQHAPMVNFYSLKTELRSGATIVVYDEFGNLSTIAGMNWLPSQSYLMTFRRQAGTQDHDGDGNVDDWEFYVRIERLSTGESVTDIVRRGKDPTGNTGWYMSAANYHFTHVQGPIISFDGNDASHELNAEAWLRNVYAGEAVSASSEEVTTTVESYQLFSKDRKVIRCRQNSHTMHSIDISFTNNGVSVKPASGIIELLIKS